ncbi:cytidylate kinase, partial [Lederbergia galactosidilytica]
SEREVSPLRKAEDAIEIDTSFLSISEVADQIYQLANERMGD